MRSDSQSSPVKPGLGVYVTVPSGFITACPLAGSVVEMTVKGLRNNKYWMLDSAGVLLGENFYLNFSLVIEIEVVIQHGDLDGYVDESGCVIV